MTLIPAREGWELSREKRRVRSELRTHVQHGGSLALLLTLRHHEELDAVPVEKLLRWIPGVGATRARRLLLGLPAAARLGELNPAEYAALVRRVRELELRLITSQFHNPKG
jgi:hypothetical protein